MTTTEKYTFKFEAFKPETMPFGRLLEYYAKINQMLGLSESVHLINVIEGSHRSEFLIDHIATRAMNERIEGLNTGQAPKPAVRAKDEINEMLRVDGTSGMFFNEEKTNLLEFLGHKSEQNIQYRVNDFATFSGELYHISGTKEDVKIRISSDAYGTVFCNTTLGIGKALRDFLFETVNVSGRGVWNRTANGEWKISDFTITDFAPIKAENLKQSVDRLRKLDISWPTNILNEIAIIEEKEGRIN